MSTERPAKIYQIVSIPLSDKTKAWADGLGDLDDPEVKAQVRERLLPIIDALVDKRQLNDEQPWGLKLSGGAGLERTITVMTVFPGLEYDSSVSSFKMRLEPSQAFERF